MKSKLLAAVIFVFLLCGVAAAQDEYYIRTNARINLRATYSIEGEKVETVPEGTILHVVGRFNRWLKIDRNGDVLWLADWVYYTRVDNGGSQEQTRSLDQFDPESYQVVDNCCQVDRECNTDEEWTSGYWAFKNNHCVAPAQPSVSGVSIEGSEAFVLQVEKALELLKNRSPEWYAYATSGLSRIREVTESNGAGVWVQFRRFDITPGHAFSGGTTGESSLIWLAGVIVHDACHVHLYEAGATHGGLEGERACLQANIEALEAIDPNDRFTSSLRNLLANIENPEYQWWH